MLGRVNYLSRTSAGQKESVDLSMRRVSIFPRMDDVQP